MGSWEDDAVIRDHARGRFLDRDRLHYVDFEGESFTVKGPAIVPRPPQGQLVVSVPRSIASRSTSSWSPSRIATAVDAANRSRGLTFIEIGRDARHTARCSGPPRRPERTHSRHWRVPRLEYIGPATGFVELLTELAAHTDGVRLFPAVIDEDLPALARHVLPALFTSGVAHRPVPGSSLRGNLGLARPVNRYAKV